MNIKSFCGKPAGFQVSLTAVLLMVSQILYSQENRAGLEEGFRNPPGSAKPRTWWHWTNSNITKEGITKDLEWMKRSGIGGMQLADVASGMGQTVEKKILFMSPEWLDAVRHTASEAERLDLEMAVFSSAGWSLTGGPWVKPDQAMKKIVWSEVNVTGPVSYNAKLPSPPDIEGPLRNLSRSGRISPSDPGFYKDCFVLVFPTPVDEAVLPVPVALTGRGNIDPGALIDDDLNSSQIIRSDKDKKIVWIEYAFEKPVTIRAITIASRAGIPVGRLVAGSDGASCRTIAVLPGAQLYRSGKVMTISFPEVTATRFRLEFTGAPMRPAEVMSETVLPVDSVYAFNEIKLHSAARIHRWEDKAGFYHLFNYDPVLSPSSSSSSSIDPEKIIDLTALMKDDGSIDWKVPAGRWTIMRFGYSLTGSRNRPAIPAGSGYEVDKLSREHTESYIREYTDPLMKSLGPLYGTRLSHVLLDSWEAGMQNWTERMPDEFRSRRGYDLIRFLPCLAGRIVGDSDMSDRVLWDFRRTLADMFAENHYKVLTEYLNKQGIKTYGEASGVSLEILEDALLCKKYTDIPMGEFWYRALHPELMYYQDVRGAASASHIYGKNLVAAEAYTGGGFESPFTLKKIGDYWFTQGINRFVFHTSAHQPLDTKPGNTMVGTHINRNITWAEIAEPFMTYLSRNSFMLQQGKFVADLAYLLGEGAPSTMPVWGAGLKPEPPEGYDYDYINADALLTRMSVSDDGKLTLPDGMTYSVLVLPNGKSMTLPVLRKIKEIVSAGATVTGPRPEKTPGFTGYPSSETEFRDIVTEVWGDLDGISRTKRTYGKGMVAWGVPLENILEMKAVLPDVEPGKQPGSEINWIHRQTADADIYLIVNSSDRDVNTAIRFRVKGREPEFWDPATGTIVPAGFQAYGNQTEVSLMLKERESVFVVFRKASDKAEREPPESPVPVSELTVTEPWKVTFPPSLGAPESIVLDTLKPLNLHADDGVRYFSGSAVYTGQIQISRSFLKNGSEFIIDLGPVGDIAELSVNDSPPVILWKAPYSAKVTQLLRSGTNTIEVKVTNQWTNRLSGDMKLPQDKKILKSPLFVRPGRLSDSGLTGPVRIIKF